MLNISEVILSERIPLKFDLCFEGLSFFSQTERDYEDRRQWTLQFDISLNEQCSSFNVIGFENGRTFGFSLF